MFNAAFARSMIAGLLVVAPCLAFSQAFPQRPLRLVVPFAAGGVTDAVARQVAEELGAALHQPVVVENKTGANGALAMEVVKQSVPDGYTLMLATVGTQAINPSLFANLRYKPEDVELVSMLTTVPQVLVVAPDRPYKSVAELVAYAKAHPGKLSYGSSGIGSAPHLAVEIFAARAGISVNHVPYRGSAQSVTDLIAGQLDFMIDPITTTQAHITSGRLRALGVSSTARLAALPDVPTIAEAGYPGYDVGVWNAVAVKSGTPGPVVEKLAGEIARILAMPKVRTRLLELGAEPVVADAARSQAFVRAEQAKYQQVIRAANIKPE
jgi:tripartite-type tricarboxylate transporter receptor subunit TctC